MKDKQIDSWTVAGHGALARAWHGDKEDKLTPCSKRCRRE